MRKLYNLTALIIFLYVNHDPLSTLTQRSHLPVSGSFFSFNLMSTICCPLDTSQAICIVCEYFIVKCESMDLCAVSFEITFPLILISSSKFWKTQFYSCDLMQDVPILRRQFVVVTRLFYPVHADRCFFVVDKKSE